MTKFMPTARVQVIAVVFAIVGNTIAIEIDGNILTNYLKPVISKIKIHAQNSKSVKTVGDSGIVKAIEKTVDEIRPRLEGHTRFDNNKPIKDNDLQDTQILELPDARKTRDNIKEKYSRRFHPEPLQGHITKYKSLRRKIGEILKTEAVSKKTKALVTETLDEMISEMLNGRCAPLKNHTEGRKEFRSSYNKDDMVKSWRHKWNKLIKQYLDAKNKDPDGLQYKEMFTFLIKLREFFFEIHDELNRQNDRKFKCQVENSDSEEKPPKKFSVVKEAPVLRDLPKKETENNKCDITICADELKNFLMDFYINLKETIDVMFKNYQAMYLRDINNAEQEEKQSFVALLRDINTEIDKKVSKTFKTQTEKLKLGTYSDRQAKVDAVKIFLKSTVDSIQKTAGKVLLLRLKSLDSKMRFTVKEDLTTTLGIELTNLNKDFSDKMCLVFLTCNGNASRRKLGAQSITAGPGEIYFKLRVGFPEPNLRRAANEIGSLGDEARDHGYNRYCQPSSRRVVFDARRYMNVVVTRTTLVPETTTTTSQSTTAKSTTKTTTKTTTRSTTKKTKHTTKAKPKTTKTIKTTTKEPETTTEKIRSTTYTYGDYVKQMIKMGKIKPRLTKDISFDETTTETVNRLIGSLLY